ncbi:PTS beta-glucoside transporter subunit EIIBCA [Corynebacterium yudongzhengii]|uniref:PTS beta-glucoside transporter subunit EIIBCA n=1 Tax=Corynebacterium yudongzhengii TaxID=2080740 RepID=A0A2U1T7T5_9CORY|nr:glucose PTS transporter subunit IIA [Corynebacterium yudongzhengii]AWB82330.1 PTS beta-glucoside transporter subunit EIIBCA [Corynebacterium yudongzhengii]PWC02052.1 PTS beta-glucoside transporter subunit EIIBCA [Corynebacterium yudongzhengii]
MATRTDTAREIVEKLGGPGNISSFTHCATRLRLQLVDAGEVDTSALDEIPEVLGVLDQGGNRLQIVMGGAVESTYAAIRNLPEMKGAQEKSDADIKAEQRAKAKGKSAWLDNFFEYLADSFRPIIGVLLGASLIIAFASFLDALGAIDFRADDKAAGWVFVDAMWSSVFHFLPILVAYNAASKLKVDPWLGGVIMAAVMTPNFADLSDAAGTVCTLNEQLGTEQCVADIFGLPMQLNDYSGQVFVPLIMVAILALLYRGLKRIIPEMVHLVFVPFISMAIMIPVTAFLIGPLGIWLGNGLGVGLSWMNTNAPFVFAILIPMLYPFLVPLGLHWPLNALMLINLQTLGYDFIQGPMGAWNFACFGATAGVLFISLRERDFQMRQTSFGALGAGLFGGISEPSLYGIHLRFKRIYPRMLLGCFAGGLTIAVLGLPSNGVQTDVFAFTSLLTIPVFNPMATYAIAIAVAFFVAMFAIVLTDYRTPEERAEFRAARDAREAREAQAAADADTDTTATDAVVAAPLDGNVVTLEETGDKVFASRALGEGVGIVPESQGTVDIVAPAAGTLMTVVKTGHAFGLRTDDGIEILVHVGVDTVKMDGEGFAVAVEKKQQVAAGEKLATVDLAAIARAGYSPITIVTVTNSKKLGTVTPITDAQVAAGDPVITVAKAEEAAEANA